jgi:DNA-directed RNA polymerase subunit F
MKGKIISEKSMNVVEVRDALEKIQERDKGLNFRAQKTLDYIQPVNKLSSKQAKELCTALEKFGISRLKEVHIHKLIDTLPATEDDVNVVLQGYTLNLKKDDMKKIAEAVKEFVSKK